MSSQEEREINLESPPLIEYLKQEIPLEEIRDYSSPKRINSIDAVKGLAILFIIACHAASVWFDEEWMFVYGIAYSVLDIFGPSLFVFLSAFSVVFSVKRKKGRTSMRVIRTRIYSRGLMIITIGILINIFTPDQMYPFPLNLWGWNILMFLGFSQIFSYHALKLKKYVRAIIGIIIISISEPVRAFLYYGQNSNLGIWILHYIITSPIPVIPLFPWLSICFISTIFGEMLSHAMEKGTKEAYKRLFRAILAWGVFFVVFGVITGLESKLPGSVNIGEYDHFALLEIANRQNYNHYDGMWTFLIRGMFANMWYNLGVALVLIAISFYIIDIKLVKNKFISMLTYYGKVSLSLFLVHYTFLFLFLGRFNIILYLFVIISYMGFMGIFMYVWMEYFKGVGSPEWIMVVLGKIGEKTEEKTVELTKKTEEFIVKETKLIAKKTEELIAKERKVIGDKTKETVKKPKEPEEENE